MRWMRILYRYNSSVDDEYSYKTSALKSSPIIFSRNRWKSWFFLKCFPCSLEDSTTVIVLIFLYLVICTTFLLITIPGWGLSSGSPTPRPQAATATILASFQHIFICFCCFKVVGKHQRLQAEKDILWTFCDILQIRQHGCMIKTSSRHSTSQQEEKGGNEKVQ